MCIWKTLIIVIINLQCIQNNRSKKGETHSSGRPSAISVYSLLDPMLGSSPTTPAIFPTRSLVRAMQRPSPTQWQRHSPARQGCPAHTTAAPRPPCDVPLDPWCSAPSGRTHPTLVLDATAHLHATQCSLLSSWVWDWSEERLGLTGKSEGSAPSEDFGLYRDWLERVMGKRVICHPTLLETHSSVTEMVRR